MFKFPIAIIGLQHHSYKQQNPPWNKQTYHHGQHDSTPFVEVSLKALYGAWKCKAQQKKISQHLFLICKVQQVLRFRAFINTFSFSSRHSIVVPKCFTFSCWRCSYSIQYIVFVPNNLVMCFTMGFCSRWFSPVFYNGFLFPMI